MKRAFLLTLATFFLTGCFEAEPEVVIGREFPLERVPAIKRHVTSKKSVEDIMGPPYRKETLPGRQTKWRYYMRKEQATYVLWVFPSSIHITETRMEIVFDGSIVESLEKSSSNFSE